MKQILKYAPIIMLGLVIAGPALAAIVLPTPPSTGSGGVVTGSSIMSLITQIFNYLVAISTIVAIAYFIWGGIQYAMGKTDEGKGAMKNAAIGLLAILGVGLVVNSIAAFINRGLNLG